MIECPKCRHDNDLGRIFCVKCGEKLEISKVSVPSSIKKRKRNGKISTHFAQSFLIGVFKTIKVFLLAAGVALLLALWIPPKIFVRSCTEKDIENFSEKRTSLEEALVSQTEAKLTLEESEINAFLAESVRKSAESAASSGHTQLDGIFVHLEDHQMQVTLCNKVKWFHFYVQTIVVPKKNDQLWSLEIESIRIGQLLIPDFLEATIQPIISRFFADLKNEKQWMESLQFLEFKPGKINLVTRKEK